MRATPQQFGGIIRTALFVVFFICNMANAATPNAASAASSSSASSPLDTLTKVLKVDPVSGSLAAKLLQSNQGTPPKSVAHGATAPSRGIIGLISTAIGSMQSRYVQVAGPWRYWQQEFHRAGQDVDDILSGQQNESPPVVLINFSEMIGLFGGIVILLSIIGKLVRKKMNVDVTLKPDPTLKELLIFALRRIVPWAIALIVEIGVVISLEPSLGRTLATIILYALIGAIVFRALCAIIFSMAHGGHRNVAIRILNQHAWKTLYVIGFSGWLGDALNNPKVYAIVGENLCSLLGIAANLIAAILCAVFAIRFRRPIAHLIRNRSWQIRHEHHARIETLNVIAAVWSVPVLLLSLGVTVATLFALNNSDAALDHAIGSAAALVGMFFAGTILLRLRNKNLFNPARSPYARRIISACFSFFQLVIWVGFFEILSLIWGSSIYTMLQGSALGRTLLEAASTTAITIIIAWIVWIVLDTMMQEAISPTRPLRRGRRIASNRMRTILPLLRNTVALLIFTISGITVLQNLGINVTPLLASAGVVGVAIGFGSQSLIKDLITGVFILIEDSMSIGEVVDVGNGHAGTVEHLSIRTVRLRDGAGSIHTIPFSQIVAIRNDSREYAVATITLQVTLDSDMDKAMKLMRETGNEMLEDAHFSRILQKPLDIWGLNAFDLNGATILGGFRTRPQSQAEVIRAFNLRIKAKIDATDSVKLANRWGAFPMVAGENGASPAVAGLAADGMGPPDVSPSP